MSFAFLPLYTGDYLRDTRHLTPVRHGIYLLLLMHSWDSKGPVPLDEQEQAGIANCRSADEIDALRYVLNRYFVRMDDGWYNERLHRELQRAEGISKDRAEAGRQGGLARATKQAKQMLSKCQANAKQVSVTPTPTTTPTPTPHSGTSVAVGSKPHSDTLTLYVADPSGIDDGHETEAALPAKPKPEKYRFTENDMALANRICEAVQEVSPSCRPNLKAWANDLRLMRERDGRSLEEIEAMFRWANADTFWRANILSVPTLRAKWPKLEARRGGSRAAYRPEERAVISAYNNSLTPRGWAEAVDDPYSPERASAITEFLRLSDKPQWVERYFCYLAASLEPRPGCGFDWAIRRETFLRAREGNFARVAA